MNMWEGKNHILEQPLGQQEIKKEIRKYLMTNENENTTCQNLWDSVKAVLRGMFMPTLKRRKVSNQQLSFKPQGTKKKKNRTSLVTQWLKSPPGNVGDTGSVPGPGRSHMSRGN